MSEWIDLQHRINFLLIAGGLCYWLWLLLCSTRLKRVEERVKALEEAETPKDVE